MINPVLLCSGCVVIMINPVLLGSGCVVIIIIPICYIPAGSVVILIIPVCYVLGCVLFMINPIFILAFLYVILDFLCEIPQYSRSVLLEAFVHLHKKLY